MDFFKVRPSDLTVHAFNMKARPDIVALKVQKGDDEVAVSLDAEAWSRTMRSKVRLVSDVAGPVRLRGGLRVQVQKASTVKPHVQIKVASAGAAGSALTSQLDRIARRYGRGTARFAALGMEYPWGNLKPMH